MAILPLSRQRMYRGLAYGFVSSPLRTYGGWLAEDTLTPPQAALLAAYLRDRVANLVWRVNPYDEAALGAASGLREDDFTQALDLRGGFEAVLRGWSRGHRSAARQAIRRGVSVRLAEGEHDWRCFYRVYRASLEREGASRVLGWDLLDLLRTRESPRVRLWLAEAVGDVVSGLLCFYAGFHAQAWLGGTLAEHFPRRPVHLLFHDAVKDGCERGLRWFDLGGSGTAGLVEFKRHLGATELPAPVIVGRRRLGPLTRRPPGVRGP
jgi:CelD/BcsL family acetyltransferase involved in cellulose biosynthesis